MPPNYFDIGDVVRTSSTFTDTGGTKADPSQVHFVYTTPDGTDNIFTRVGATTGTVDSIVRGATAGTYHSDITTTSSGTYWYRYNSTGNITSAAEANFRVRNRRTDT